jgi:hypothetical protein
MLVLIAGFPLTFIWFRIASALERKPGTGSGEIWGLFVVAALQWVVWSQVLAWIVGFFWMA